MDLWADEGGNNDDVEGEPCAAGCFKSGCCEPAAEEHQDEPTVWNSGQGVSDEGLKRFIGIKRKAVGLPM